MPASPRSTSVALRPSCTEASRELELGAFDFSAAQHQVTDPYDECPACLDEHKRRPAGAGLEASSIQRPPIRRSERCRNHGEARDGRPHRMTFSSRLGDVGRAPSRRSERSGSWRSPVHGRKRRTTVTSPGREDDVSTPVRITRWVSSSTAGSRYGRAWLRPGQTTSPWPPQDGSASKWWTTTYRQSIGNRLTVRQLARRARASGRGEVGVP